MTYKDKASYDSTPPCIQKYKCDAYSMTAYRDVYISHYESLCSDGEI